MDTVSQKPCKMESKKRPARDSSESSAASTSNKRKSRQSPSLTGGKLSYENSRHELLSHTNNRGRVRDILENRHKSTGNSVTGACIANDSEPPYLYTTTMKKVTRNALVCTTPRGHIKPQWYTASCLKTLLSGLTSTKCGVSSAIVTTLYTTRMTCKSSL